MMPQEPTIYAYDGYFYILVFSKDEGGWYGEISDIEGETIDRTEIWATRALAKHDTIKLIENLKTEDRNAEHSS
jgi:hypothetical protein